MLGMSHRRALVACAAWAVLAHSLVDRCSCTTEETATLNHEGEQEQAHVIDVSAAGELQKQSSSSSTLPEGKNPASQVASLNQGNQVQAPAFLKTASGELVEKNQRGLYSHEIKADNPPASRRLQSPVEADDFRHDNVFSQYPFKAAARRRPENTLKSIVDTQELLSEHIFPHQRAPTRRLQLLSGLSQLAQPFAAVSSLFGSGLSARDQDQLETFSRRVAVSRERVYKDLLFVTGGKHQGLDEYAMKQLVAKVGLENLATGNVPSSVQLSRQESLVLDAAKRSRFQVERIILTYEREVAQHAKTLRQEMHADTNQHSLRAKIDSIASEGLFKKQTLTVRRLQQAPRIRRLANLLQGPGLLGNAGSLFRSIDPLNISHSINASLGGLGLHHLHLPNIGGLGLRQDGNAAVLPLGDVSGLQQALESIFPVRQQAAALATPLRSFQQGVSTATEGAIGAFLSKEGLLPFLSVDTTKHMLEGLMGGAAIAPHGASGWDELGLSPAAAKGLAGIMSFDTFLNKLGVVAQEVDADVGTLKRETKRRIGAEGFPVLPEQLLQVDGLLDRLVWGSLHAPLRRLQEVEKAPETHQALQEEQQPHQQSEVQEQVANVQHQAVEAEQQVPEIQLGAAQEEASQTHQEAPKAIQETAQAPQPAAAGAEEQAPEVEVPTVPEQEKVAAEQQEESGEEGKGTVNNLFEALLSEEGFADETPEEQLDSALQRIELLADAVTVLLKEYEKAVEHLQKLLDEQIEAAEDIRDELEEQVMAMKQHVTTAHQKQQQQTGQKGAAAAAATEVARAYDEAMGGIKGSFQDLLQQAQQEQEVAPAVQQELTSMAAKIEAAAEEGLLSPVVAH